MDPVFLGGLLLALLGLIVALLLDGNSLGVLISPTSLLLVLAPTIGAAIMAYRKSEIGMMPAAGVKALKADIPDVQDIITQLAKLAEVARRDGMLALEAEMERIDDRFLQLGVQLLVDGSDEQVVRETLEIELEATDERHRATITFYRTMAGYAPTFAMVGTVVALVNMLSNLSDPDQLGRGMSMALLTTFYGVMFANLLFNPIAARLERLNDVELAGLEVAIDGILSIRGGASPRGVIERLESYLPPAKRIGVGDRLGGGGSSQAAA